MPEPGGAFEATMLQGVAQIAVLGANPVNALAVRLGLGFGLIQCLCARGVDFLNALAFFRGFLLLQLPLPAHLFGDSRLGFVGVAVFIQQLHVFVRARVALLQELLVVVLVPLLFGVLLPTLMALDALGERFQIGIYPAAPCICPCARRSPSRTSRSRARPIALRGPSAHADGARRSR